MCLGMEQNAAQWKLTKHLLCAGSGWTPCPSVWGVRRAECFTFFSRLAARINVRIHSCVGAAGCVDMGMGHPAPVRLAEAILVHEAILGDAT